MEFVGKTVRKEFKGFGVFSGVIKSYDLKSGFYKIEYEDGDFDEMDVTEVSSILEAEGRLVEETPGLGRKPKKRSRVENKLEIGDEPGIASENSEVGTSNNGKSVEMDLLVRLSYAGGMNKNNLNDGALGGLEMSHGVGRSLREGVEFNGNLNADDRTGGGFGKTLENNRGIGDDLGESFSGNWNMNGSNHVSGRFDLNEGLNMCDVQNMGDGSDLHFCNNEKLNADKRGSIDLNLDANGDLGETSNGVNAGCSAPETKKRERNFDLNIEVDDENRDNEEGGGRELDFCDYPRIAEGSRKNIDGHLEEKVLLGGSEKRTLEAIQGAEGISSLSTLCKDKSGDLAAILVEEMKKETGVRGGDVAARDSSAVSDPYSIKDCDLVEVELKDGFSEFNIAITPVDHGDMESSCRQHSGRRKRRKLSDNLKSPEMVLRRSARRGAGQNNASVSSCAADAPVSSAAVSAVSEEKHVMAARIVAEKPDAIPPKLQLPPSSQNLLLLDIPVLDLFSIYACLRSFSAQLFLSPFELEDFVAALKCEFATPLSDHIHLSILQTLRKHLEFLSSEGSESAANCLRSLNWDFLDLVTWPIFMVLYLLNHGSGLKPGLHLTRLKLFENDYFKLPTSVKVEMLRCLCDDILQVEAIISEINRRSMAAEPELAFDRSVRLEVYKKRKVSMDVSGSSCLTEDIVDETTDWNSDECCLCKMDGSLICCDGCPAAYHSKCVGISNDLLPEGDWYCPECAINRDKPGIQLQKTFRGAELLGIDPHGRLYFSSCDYLLVSEPSDSCDSEPFCQYYHRNDLNVFIEALKSFNFYHSILVAICKHWNITFAFDKKGSKLDFRNNASCSEIVLMGETSTISVPFAPIVSSDSWVAKNERRDRKHEGNSIGGCTGNFGHEIAKNLSDSMEVTRCSPAAAKEYSQATALMSDDQHTKENNPSNTYGPPEVLQQATTQGKLSSVQESSWVPHSIDGKQEDTIDSMSPLLTAAQGDIPEVQNGNSYFNCYSFAQIASSVAEVLMGKSSDVTSERSSKSEEELIAAQMKIILNKTPRFSWPLVHNLSLAAWKEKCGWCLNCKASSDDSDCLFCSCMGPVEDGCKSEVFTLQSKGDKGGHFKAMIFKLLSMERRLQGLLRGPWLKSHHTKLWHRSILEASDLTSIKYFLLMLESNLHHLTISTEWLKYVDSDITLGSAAHIVPSARGILKHGIGRKRARSDIEPKLSSNAANGLSMFWWRGGRLSRQLFNWKVLPRSLASKAARQAGCTKIPGILYPEGSQYAKRSRRVTWQAAVETSICVEQLAFQVRELDSNIKWDDIENSRPLPVLDKETRKSIRLFKKVIIRRKSTEQNRVKYLLDFGKRRSIPDVVKINGTAVEECSSEKKRYWLEEMHVPLHLLKNFEEKRISRKSNEVKDGKLLEVKCSERRGFAYLFSKAERSENYECGHCGKDVPIREAVTCQQCNGFFHKRHVRKFSDSVIAECAYTCHKCRDGMNRKIDVKKEKSRSAKSKKGSNDSQSSRIKSNKRVLKKRKLRSQSKKKVPPAVPLRRSARKAKCISLQIRKAKKTVGRKKGKKNRAKKGTTKKQKKGTSWKKKRTQGYHTYWLNGLHLSGKPIDERVTVFKERNIHLMSQNLSEVHQPKCHLCSEAEPAPSLAYISCEICGEWFHGDAFELSSDKIDKLIGFKCHTCLKRTPPVCPHKLAVEISNLGSLEMQNDAAVECAVGVAKVVPSLNEITCD